mmetsp:Transcript_134106/g.347306  ORF Transcript_134106/g.347306 Transcript_134106/m.347306 type:complete len:510 (-) Transcript_134106:645-2174(-)
MPQRGSRLRSAAAHGGAGGLVEPAVDLAEEPLHEEDRSEGAHDGVAACGALHAQLMQRRQQRQRVRVRQQTISPFLPRPRHQQKCRLRRPHVHAHECRQLRRPHRAPRQRFGEARHRWQTADLADGRPAAAAASWGGGAGAGLQEGNQSGEGLRVRGEELRPPEAPQKRADQAPQRREGRQAVGRREPRQPPHHRAERRHEPPACGEGLQKPVHPRAGGHEGVARRCGRRSEGVLQVGEGSRTVLCQQRAAPTGPACILRGDGAEFFELDSHIVERLDGVLQKLLLADRRRLCRSTRGTRGRRWVLGGAELGASAVQLRHRHVEPRPPQQRQRRLLQAEVARRAIASHGTNDVVACLLRGHDGVGGAGPAQQGLHADRVAAQLQQGLQRCDLRAHLRPLALPEHGQQLSQAAALQNLGGRGRRAQRGRQGAERRVERAELEALHAAGREGEQGPGKHRPVRNVRRIGVRHPLRQLQDVAGQILEPRDDGVRLQDLGLVRQPRYPIGVLG